MVPERRFLRWFFACTATLLAGVAGLNWVVDPYSVFGNWGVDRVNVRKPDFVEHLRLTNAYATARIRPNCVILGTSRTGKGLDPASAALAGLDCYNMALPSTSLYEMRRYFQHAHAVAPQRRVILAFDFRVFTTLPDTTGAFSDVRLAVDAEGQRQFNLFSARFPDMAGALLSMSAVQSSAKTVRQQGWPGDTLTPNGHWTTRHPGFDHRSAFIAYTRNTLERYTFLPRRDAAFARARDELRNLLRVAYASGADVSMFISPSHAWHWQTMQLAGIWPRFEAIKRDIVQANEEAAARAGRPAFAIWDFSGAYGPSVESVPTSSGVAMTWYWEPVHYTRQLGDLMLNRMLNGTAAGDWPDFGIRISTENLESHLARLRDLQEDYAARNTEAVATIRALMQGAGR